MKHARWMFLIILLNLIAISFPAWQKHSGRNCSKGFGATPLGRSKKKTLAQCKKLCQKKRKCVGVLRKTKNGKKKGICQLTRKIKLDHCKEDEKYTFYQLRGFPSSTTVKPTLSSTTEGSTGAGCKGGVSAYPTILPSHDYYTQLCTSHSGLRIISGSKASETALEKTAFIIDKVMANVDPRVAPEMNRNGFRHAVMAAYPAELTTDIPEHAHLGEWWDERARGLGATLHIPVGSSAEENVLCHPDDRYRGEDITIHEFAHSMHLTGLTLVFPGFDSELQQLYSAAKAGSFWGSQHYAMTNYIEYFAEGVQSYFDANYRDSNAPTSREELQTQDPNFFVFLDKYLGGNDWRQSPC